jgi:hypothetical protein
MLVGSSTTAEAPLMEALDRPLGLTDVGAPVTPIGDPNMFIVTTGAPARLLGDIDRFIGAPARLIGSSDPSVPDPKLEDPINIYIATPGMKEEYKLGRPYIVYSLMRMIENRQGISTDRQTLLYGSAVLKEFATLEEYHIYSGAEITLVVEAVGLRRIWNWVYRKLASTIRLVAVCWRPVHEKEKLSPKL